MKKRADLSGLVFGRLTVIGDPLYDGKRWWWNCTCSCGKSIVVRTGNLVNGGTKSCGCSRSDVVGVRSPTFKHGRSKTKTYYVWCTMKDRCYRKEGKQYVNYGGRGIDVCSEWHNFDKFYADMGEKPVGMSLERIDNTKGYSPENCEWASRKTQGRNTRANILVQYDGRSQCLSAWCEELNLPYDKTHNRLTNLKWSVDRCFTTN